MRFFVEKRFAVAAGVVVVYAMIFAWYFLAGDNKETDEGSKVAACSSMGTYEQVIAITFDDGPRYKTTTKLLDGLAERNVQATFFLVGKNAEVCPEVVERMYEEGHLIGNHTYSHVQLTNVNLDKACEEITKTNEIIYEITGYCPLYIRSPYGSYTTELECGINMTNVLWDVDPKDWNTTDVAAIVKNVVDNAEDGDIILMHDIYDTSVTAALEIIDCLKEKGFEFVTVDEILIE